jgi:hypothetical protein
MNKDDTEKEKWIERVLQSVEGIEPAEGNPFLYQRVLTKISARASGLISVRVVWLCTAAMVMIVALDIAAVKKMAGPREGESASVIVSEYQLSVAPDEGIIISPAP